MTEAADGLRSQGRCWRRIKFVELPASEVVGWIAAHPELAVPLVDLDNTVVPYGSSPGDETRLIDEAVDQLLGLPHVSRVVLHTNMAASRPGPSLPLRDGVSAHYSVSKPLTPRHVLEGNHGGVVVGDLILTDGLLAWRLGLPYVHAPLTEQDPQLYHRLFRRVGRLIKPLFFHD